MTLPSLPRALIRHRSCRARQARWTQWRRHRSPIPVLSATCTRGDSVGPDFVSPLYATNVTNDPLRAEIARLRVPVLMPQRDVMVTGERVPLNAQHYDEYQRTAGFLASQALHARWSRRHSGER